MQKGALIGRGMTAEVYEWGPDQVLKLYYARIPKEWVTFEQEIGKAVSAAGISSPIVYELVQEEGRSGLIYQRIKGFSMLKVIESSPWKIVKYAKSLAQIHFQMHQAISSELPRQKKTLQQAIQHSSDLLGAKAEDIYRYVAELPDNNHVCHGDFHPDNILLQDSGYAIIDWTNANSGDPLCDVARTCLMLSTPFVPPGAPKLIMRLIKRLMYSAYIKEYLKLSKAAQADIDAWLLPVAAARLREKVPGEEQWLLNLIDQRFAAQSKK